MKDLDTKLEKELNDYIKEFKQLYSETDDYKVEIFALTDDFLVEHFGENWCETYEANKWYALFGSPIRERATNKIEAWLES